MAEGLVSRHVSGDGTLVRANASFKSFVPLEVALDPAAYKRRLRTQDREAADGPPDPGNRAVHFRGEKRSNATHRSATDPDCRFVSKGTSGTGAYPGYTVNAVMENRHRFLAGLGVEVFQGPTSDAQECLALLARAIELDIATEARGSAGAHTRVGMRQRGLGYRLSQRCRKLIEELFGEAKDWHGLRRFRRRGLHRVRQEAHLTGWVLNLHVQRYARSAGGGAQDSNQLNRVPAGAQIFSSFLPQLELEFPQRSRSGEPGRTPTESASGRF